MTGTEEVTRATPEWLRLREPADGAARSRDLLPLLLPHLHPREADGVVVVHDLGCGSGSMGRWLAPLVDAPQHWVLHDRDADLLALAANSPPPSPVVGTVTLETRATDLAELQPEALAEASLVTASALLDMLTAPELDQLMRCCILSRCPWLVTLSVTGRVWITPEESLDEDFRAAFNDHQRRRTAAGPRRLGPDAVGQAVRWLRSAGLDVVTRPSPWELDARDRALTAQWLEGWVGAACEQRPELLDAAPAYVARRTDALARGRLSVTVHHLDVLVRPHGYRR